METKYVHNKSQRIRDGQVDKTDRQTKERRNGDGDVEIKEDESQKSDARSLRSGT